MSLLEFFLMAVWTAVVVRLFAARATLTDRTFIAFVMLGALVAFTAVPLAQRLVAPYPLNDYNRPLLAAFLGVAVRNIVLLIPLLAYLFIPRTDRLLSIADAFLLAFSIGFGFELPGAFLVASVPHLALRGYTLFPPGQFTWDEQQRAPIFGFTGGFALAGVGYSISLPIMALAVALRFSRKMLFAVPAALLVLVLVSTHEALWTHQIGAVGQTRPTSGFFLIFDRLMFHGTLIALGALVLLAYFSLVEARWVAGSKPFALKTLSRDLRDAILRLVDGWHRGLSAALLEGVSGYQRDQAIAGLTSQIALAQTQAKDVSNSVGLQASTRRLQTELDKLRATHARSRASSPRWTWIDVWLAAAFLALAVIVSPMLPAELAPKLWEFGLLNFPLPLVGVTLMQLLLVALLLGQFVLSPGRSRSSASPDAALRRSAERAVSVSLAGLALLVLFRVPLNSFYPPLSTVAVLNHVTPPPLELAQLTTLILLFGMLAGAATRHSTMNWQNRASPREKRTAIITNSSLVVTASLFLLLSTKMYVPLLTALQSQWGPAAFDKFNAMGNVVIALAAALIVFVVAFASGLAMRLVSQRVEQFIIGPESPEQPR